MDIAQLSTELSMSNIAQQVDMAVYKLGKEQIENTGAQLAKMLESSVQPNLGRNIDIRI